MSPKEKQLLLGYVLHKAKEYTLKGLVEILLRNPGKSIFEFTWDNMIILDACRADALAKTLQKRKTPGKFSIKTSLGCWTGEFLIKNFGNQKHRDIVYITANPYVDKYLKNNFYKIISVWKSNWDPIFNTVLPKAVYNEALKALKKYPRKRLIIHFMQPHHPYITLKKYKDRDMELIKREITSKQYPFEPLNKIYLARIYAEIPSRRLVQAYKDNLELVFPYVELLLSKLPGISVVTSDHGELFGEKVIPFVPIQVYGHGIGRNSNLVNVPWLEVNPEDKTNLDIKVALKDTLIWERYIKIRKRQIEQERISKTAISKLSILKTQSVKKFKIQKEKGNQPS